MELVLVAASALIAGVAIGAILGGRRALALVLAGRSSRGGVVPSFMPSTMPTRSAADILAGRVRIRLGNDEFTLPVLARGPAHRWLAQLDARFARLAAGLDRAADDPPAALALLMGESEAMYDMLRSYDPETIPPRDDETMTDAQILHAVLEVWRAVHPLVAAVDNDPGGSTTSTSSGPPRLPLTPTAGGLDTSRTN